MTFCSATWWTFSCSPKSDSHQLAFQTTAWTPCAPQRPAPHFRPLHSTHAHQRPWSLFSNHLLQPLVLTDLGLLFSDHLLQPLVSWSFLFRPLATTPCSDRPWSSLFRPLATTPSSHRPWSSLFGPLASVPSSHRPWSSLFRPLATTPSSDQRPPLFFQSSLKPYALYAKYYKTNPWPNPTRLFKSTFFQPHSS